MRHCSPESPGPCNYPYGIANSAPGLGGLWADGASPVPKLLGARKGEKKGRQWFSEGTFSGAPRNSLCRKCLVVHVLLPSP